MFTRTLTAGVLAASLALTSLTPTTASAQLSEDDALVGLIALLFLGAAIHNNRNDDVQAAPVTHPSPPRGWRNLPHNCMRDITRRNGDTIRMFTQRCLNTNYAHVDRLPEVCRVHVRTQNSRPRNGFRASCLRDQGFRTSRR